MNFKGKTKGFTLLELLIYSAILAISAGAIGSIFFTISKSSLKIQAENEVNNQITRLEEVFRQKIGSAKGVNAISGSLLELNMGNFTSTFSLSDNVVYLQEGIADPGTLNDPDKVKVTSLSFTPTGASGAQISNTYHYAWSGNVGWIDFAYPGSYVQVPIGEGDLTGFAYVLSLPDSHWVSLNCISTNSCASVQYKVSSDVSGNLSGWAWSENFGWISFNCLTDNTCSFSDYKVTKDNDTGEFDGYAWSENIGWISFNCKTGGDNQANICSTSNYKVQDLRMQTSSVKVEITLEYNSPKPELAISRTNTFVFNLITPSK